MSRNIEVTITSKGNDTVTIGIYEPCSGNHAKKTFDYPGGMAGCSEFISAELGSWVEMLMDEKEVS